MTIDYSWTVPIFPGQGAPERIQLDVTVETDGAIPVPTILRVANEVDAARSQEAFCHGLARALEREAPGVAGEVRVSGYYDSVHVACSEAFG